MEVAWLVAGILFDMEEKVVVFQATRTPHKKWKGQSLVMGVEVADEDIEKEVRSHKGRRWVSNVRVEGRIPRCYKCDTKGHIRADSPLPPGKTEERRKKEKVTVAQLPLEVEERTREVTPVKKNCTSVEDGKIENK